MADLAEDVDFEETNEDDEGEEGEDTEEDSGEDGDPKTTIVYSSWDELCDDISDKGKNAATHFRYRRFTRRRHRWCEKGRYFSLDAEDPGELPKPTRGDYHVVLYRASYKDGKTHYLQVTPDKTKVLSVCFRGRLPGEAVTKTEPTHFDQAHLQAYNQRVADIHLLTDKLIALANKPEQENKRLRRQVKKLRKKNRQLEQAPTGVVAFVREVREALGDPNVREAIKEIRGTNVLTALLDPDH